MDRLIPPWESVEVIRPADGPHDGATAVLRVGLGPLKCDWVAEHCQTIFGLQFADTQKSGPFAFWHHLHKVEPTAVDQCALVDRIEYELPASLLSEPTVGGFVREKLRRMFHYRHEVTASDMALLKKTGGQVMKVLVTGSHGLVGSHLIPFLTSQGHQIVRLVRSHAEKDDVLWNPSSGDIDRDALEGFDAVVHLAGDNIASGRWTAAKKEEIRASRVEGTKLLCETLATLKKPPEVLVSASAIGFYGDRADEVLNEESSAGTGFLAELCRDWEEATRPAKQSGIRVANLRIGVVLSPRGGALTKMLPAFQIGAGGNIGSGRQWMSWISVDDLTGAINHALTHKGLEGPVNAVAPQAVTNKQFTSALGEVLHRPTFLPLPGFAAHLLLGEMADELLLSSALVKPSKLVESGYTFRYPMLEPMLKKLLGAA
ncbi:MAG: TIGR01777 family oxidoreductase [Cyanobacteria bacterium]|nr:TIGR01777 family oxidoreductase [Cyanobacteriota bacterium]